MNSTIKLYRPTGRLPSNHKNLYESSYGVNIRCGMSLGASNTRFHMEIPIINFIY